MWSAAAMESIRESFFCRSTDMEFIQERWSSIFFLLKMRSYYIVWEWMSENLWELNAWKWLWIQLQMKVVFATIISSYSLEPTEENRSMHLNGFLKSRRHVFNGEKDLKSKQTPFESHTNISTFNMLPYAGWLRLS